MSPAKKHKNVPAPIGGNGIEALPDGVLEHILGFLPVEEAGRTSVLARSWRHRWKYATALRVRCLLKNNCGCPQPCFESWEDVDDMLRLRGCAPLEVCKITFASFYDDDDVVCLNRWVRHVVMCQVQRFRLENHYTAEHLVLDNLPLVSRHLTRLELVGLWLNNGFCDFSSCPSLQYLELGNCFFRGAKKLSSDSIKWLSMTSCDFKMDFGTLILVPGLVSLRLDSHLHRRPMLGSMPLLQEAFVRVPYLDNITEYCEEEDCYSCHDIMDDNKCALLNGLSNAEYLALLSESDTFIFRTDLARCPKFSKLKTLVLNDSWCVAPHFCELTSILKNSPVLEILILQLCSKERDDHTVEIIGRYHPMERSAVISEHLKSIKIKCEVVDEKVQKVLKFMCALNICK
ncbi:unnamed protein product [Urochloa decumbens]|uniref:F-box domain-containing protein n=1 Tax=Urochloa decumbens TaxID=240449 RepID=A0ABC9H812_9POAL